MNPDLCLIYPAELLFRGLSSFGGTRGGRRSCISQQRFRQKRLIVSLFLVFSLA